MTSEILLNIELALEYAIEHIHIQIAECPDVHYFAEDIEALKVQRDDLRKLLDRVQIKLGRV